MSWKCEKVHESPLRPARSEEEYLLHQAALEWTLADCIVIQTAEDIQSRASWRDRLEPYHHQVQNLFTFCRRLPVTLLADDVGLGKTISAGLILSELMARRRVSRALVLCPKILCPQWAEELDAKFAIPARPAFGGDLDKELGGGSPVVVTTYESAADRLADLRPAAFDMLVLDEAHKLRNLHGGNKPPKMATSVQEALRRPFKFVVMLTATPIQNRIWDLYSLLDCLTIAKGHRNPLGTPEQFRQLYLTSGTDGRKLHPPNAEEFRRILRQYVVRTRRGDAQLQFPTRDVHLVRVDLSPQERELTRLVAGHIAGLNALQQTSLAQAMMSSPPPADLAGPGDVCTEVSEPVSISAGSGRAVLPIELSPGFVRRNGFACRPHRTTPRPIVPGGGTTNDPEHHQA
jgi:SNF2 family DNA or RNA helicase